MYQRLAKASAALLIMSGGIASSGLAARCETLRCSNAEAGRTISSEVASQLASFSQLFSHQDPRGQLDAAKVAATLSNSYEAGHSEFTKECHSHLVVGYEGAKVEAEIDYQVIQTDDGRIITKWLRDAQFTQALYMQLALRMSFTDDQIRALDAR